MRRFAVRFLIWLPDGLFILMVKILTWITNIFHDAAKLEVASGNTKKGLSKKHLLMLAEIYENGKRA